MKGESFDDDGSRFLIGISKKMQGHKRALTESDQKALKQSVDARYYRKAPADHSIHIAAIEGAYDAFKTGKDCILREFEDKREGSTTTLVLKKTKTASSCRTIFMTEALKEELKHWFKCLEMDEADMDGRYRNSGMLLRLPNGLAVEPILIRKKFIKWQDEHPEFTRIVFHGLRHPYVKPTTKKFYPFSKFNRRLFLCFSSGLCFCSVSRKAFNFSFSSGKRQPKLLLPCL